METDIPPQQRSGSTYSMDLHVNRPNRRRTCFSVPKGLVLGALSSGEFTIENHHVGGQSSINATCSIHCEGVNQVNHLEMVSFMVQFPRYIVWTWSIFHGIFHGSMMATIRLSTKASMLDISRIEEKPARPMAKQPEVCWVDDRDDSYDS